MNEHIMQQCEDSIRRGSSSFYHAFRALPERRRHAVYVIYAFCRLIDDSVDEPDQSPFTIHELRERFLRLDEADDHFIWPALRWLFGSFPALDRQPFLSQMDGQLSDLTLLRYETMEQLERYCYLVAGTVGEMLLPVLRDDLRAEAAEAGIALGKGMQIVNIIRDVGEDRERGRRYIPADLMRRHGYTDADLERGAIDERFVALIDELHGRAEEWFARGLSNLDSYPPQSGMAVALAAAFYGAIFDQVRRNGYDVFGRRAFVPDEEKAALFLGVAARFADGEADSEVRGSASGSAAVS
ncbi:phytoene/squalene synthase family protein [Saccharibacillus sp. CPCC 101409]|uniref:phytoene/squalene synthase family protein n=1 Tax=Saccharibacillus sp. CPCC 101409 TaxID=3058041 RepID=UPI00267154F0|nr:phytoene/squalene synthase family protein [Saccharibacillus sp. CPCC 101409]MDO3412139.1 phytoene/squalene synthase family protein [Saccharibacillus sp. CPCC 101409]